MEAEVRLSEQFADLWPFLGEECRSFLNTAEILRGELDRFAAADPSIDFSPAVIAYSKALERELLDRLFAPFVAWGAAVEALPEPTGGGGVDRSISALRGFIEGSKTLALGEMSYCLRNIGCKMREVEPNVFAHFLTAQLVSHAAFCDEARFPQQLQKYVVKYRNQAAHVERLTREDCEGARAFLLDEPVRLLMTLTRSLRGAPETV